MDTSTPPQYKLSARDAPDEISDSLKTDTEIITLYTTHVFLYWLIDCSVCPMHTQLMSKAEECVGLLSARLGEQDCFSGDQ